MATYADDNYGQDSQGLWFHLSDDNTCAVAPAQSGSYSMTDVTIPSTFTYEGVTYTVTSIESNAFTNCSNLTSISIPSTITTIGENVFSGGCRSITKVNITDLTAWCKMNFPTSYSNPTWNGADLYLNDVKVTDLVIPDGITAIGNYAFMGTKITSVTIPEGVTSIGNMAFNQCSSMTYVSFPSTVTSVSTYAFNGCSKLTALYITDLAAWSQIDFPLSNSNPLYYAKNLYLNNELITDLVIPSGVATIGMNSFVKGNFNSVTISEGVTSIGSSAFASSSLKSLSTPSSLTTIGNSAFSSTNIETLTLNEGLTSIEKSAFSNCSNLKSVTLPNSVTSVGSGIFKLCANLTSVTLGSGLTSIGEEEFYGCTSLVNFTIPDGTTSIEQYAFYGCTSLLGIESDKFNNKGETGTKNVLVIPNSVASIGQSAFANCTALENVWFGKGLGNIAANAFGSDTNIATISPTSDTAPILAESAFSATTYANAQLILNVDEDNPNYQNILASYQSDGNNWVKFTKDITTNVNKIEADRVDINVSGRSIDVCGNQGEIAVYDLTGTLVYKGSNNRIELNNSGIYAVIINNKCYKIAVR
jgi:hypothetical protein